MEFNVNITSTKIIQNDPAFLKCKSLDDTLVSEFMWFKDGQIIDKNNKLNITIDDVTNTLNFKNLSRFVHNGKYRCAALLIINNQMINSSVFDLIVKCKRKIYNCLFKNDF